MQARYNRKIKSGEEYEHFFEKATGKQIRIEQYADVEDTLAFIPKVVHSTLNQTKALAESLRGGSIDETCQNIWYFVYQHIAYQKDDEGKEQIRSPVRVWQDRRRGVDCDCYTTFISSLLTNLKIAHKLRITKYGKANFQHIYPIVPLPNGKHITIDCVVESYNYEEPYTEKKDTTMELQFLNGPNDDEVLFTSTVSNVDVDDLFGLENIYYPDEIGETEDLGRRKAKSSGGYEPKSKTKVGRLLKKVAHIANRANPATVMLRNGVLASMKLNLFKTAQRLKWSYLSDADAKAKGIDIQKFERLKKVRAKLESIYYGSGGKPVNLKNAILKGKGNKGGDVNGVGNIATDDYYDEDEAELLGLGEPATGAAVVAATAVITSIAGILKSIGNIFPKQSEGSPDFENTDGGEQGASSQVAMNSAMTVSPSINENGEANSNSNVAPSSETSLMRTSGETKENAEDDKPEGEGIWDKHKKWMKPALIGTAGLGVVYLGYRLLSNSSNKTQPTQSKPTHAKSLQGINKKKKPTKKKNSPKKKHKAAHPFKKPIHKKSLF